MGWFDDRAERSKATEQEHARLRLLVEERHRAVTDEQRTKARAATLEPDTLVSLLGVYGGQFASYTTLLWQVPALSLTAQSFLLTLTLGSTSSPLDRFIASLLSLAITVASFTLMYSHRGRAINYGELARRLSRELGLDELLGPLDEADADPKHTEPGRVWEVNHGSYQFWRICLALFGAVDLFIIALSVFHIRLGWLGSP